MTTLIAWTSRDHRFFAAFYIASDSRITWGSSQNRWDAGRKVFSLNNTPDIFGYCGDVVFPALVLGQISSAANAGLLFPECATAKERHSKVLESIKLSMDRTHHFPTKKFSILHASRDGCGPNAKPLLWHTSYDPKIKFRDDLVNKEGFEGVYAVHGSGTASTKEELYKWNNSDIGGTSRAIYSAFCEAISSGADSLSGGSPQLASIYPRGGGRTVGVIYNNMLYVHGLPVLQSSQLKNMDWYDSLFQRIDPETMKLRKGAQRHAKPKL